METMAMAIDWNSPLWGQAGSNVHESATGSWLDGEVSDDHR